MFCASLITTVNSKLYFSEFKTTGKSGINKLWLGKYFLNGHPTRNCKSGLFLELRPEDHWCYHDSIMFFSQFLVVLKAPLIHRMPDFDDNICPQRTAVPPSCEYSTTRWVQKCLVCCCINSAICQEGMYTVANKAILSVCCVVRC